MESKAVNIFNQKSIVLCAAGTSLFSQMEEFSLTQQFVDLGTGAMAICALVSALLIAALIRPVEVKSISSFATIAMSVYLVVLSLLKPVMGGEVEAMWTTLCVGLVVTLIVQVAADTRMALPQIKAVISYKSS